MTATASRAHLRVVGGNAALAPLPRVGGAAHWPPLRVVAQHEAPPAPPPTADVSPASKAIAWRQVLMSALLLGLLGSVGQALAEHW